MKNLFFIYVLVLILSGCSKEYEISFCTKRPTEFGCNPKVSSAKNGTRVYVFFERDKPFDGNYVTGIFYHLEGESKMELGSQDWQLHPGDDYAIDYVDFSVPGVYEFEFLSDNGEILATNQIRIE